MDAADVVGQLRRALEDPDISEETVARIFEYGEGAVPGLMSVVRGQARLNDPYDTARGQAASLLVALAGPDAVEPLLDGVTADGPQYSFGISDALKSFGTLAGERALARISRGGDDANADVLYWILASSGFRSDQAFETLVGYFGRETDLGASCLSDYGDPRGAAVLRGYLETLGEPNCEGLYTFEQVLEAY